MTKILIFQTFGPWVCSDNKIWVIKAQSFINRLVTFSITLIDCTSPLVEQSFLLFRYIAENLVNQWLDNKGTMHCYQNSCRDKLFTPKLQGHQAFFSYKCFCCLCSQLQQQNCSYYQLCCQYLTKTTHTLDHNLQQHIESYSSRQESIETTRCGQYIHTHHLHTLQHILAKGWGRGSGVQPRYAPSCNSHKHTHLHTDINIVFKSLCASHYFNCMSMQDKYHLF